jgi:hypothetical protein
VAWSGAQPVDVSAPWGAREPHRLDVYLVAGEVVDVRLDGESVWPTWFKVEWKGNGEISAKVHGVRLATRVGDAIAIHQGRPPD